MDAGSDDVTIPRAGALIVSDRTAVAVAGGAALSVTFTVKVLDPAVLGVPVMVPPADRLSPAGSDPLASDHE